MYKMLIVDDNPRHRRNAANITNWDALEISIVGEYANGKLALDNIDTSNPDIILADVSMPVMDGIEMARLLKESHPNIKIIFMSCYDEFEYVRSAIDLDAYGYILKPFKAEELIRVIKKVLNIYKVEDALQKEREEMAQYINQSLPLLQEQFLRELLYGTCSANEDILKRWRFLKMELPQNYKVRVIVFHLNIDPVEQTRDDMDYKYLTSYTIKRIIDNMSCNCKLYSLQSSSMEYSIIAIKDDAVPESPEKDSNDFWNIVVKLKEDIKAKLNIDIVIGISNTSDNIRDIYILNQQALSALNTKVYTNGSQMILYQEIEDAQNASFEEKVNLQELFMEVKQLLSRGGTGDILKFIDKYLSEDTILQSDNYIKSLSFSIVNSIQIILMENDESFDNIFNEKLIVWNKLDNFNTIKDVRNWLFNLINTCRQYLSNKDTQGYGPVVQKIKDYIHNHYHERITLEDFARLTNYSGTHLTNVFREATGKTVFDYLIDYRMEKAKEMLKSRSSKIYLVAEQVGYTNISHFCLQFKKHTGLSPTEFKNS